MGLLRYELKNGLEAACDQMEVAVNLFAHDAIGNTTSLRAKFRSVI